jgi:putative SOS response-associated peptidase YedK
MAAFKRLAAPYPAEEMTCWPVSMRVCNVKNNDPSLIGPWRSPLTKGFRANWRLFDLG